MLRGAAAAYLLYKAYDQWGDSDSDLGKKVREAAPTLGGAAAEAAKQTTRRAKQASRRIKERFQRTAAQETVLERFQNAFPESEGWRWSRQEGFGETGRFGSCRKLQYRSRATLYFRDEERGNVARVAGKASFFPPAMREYLANNVPHVQENKHWDYCISPEHADAIIEVLRNGRPPTAHSAHSLPRT